MSIHDHETEDLTPTPGGAYKFDAKEFPWWLVGLLSIIALMVLAIIFSEAYQEAFVRIFPLGRVHLLHQLINIKFNHFKFRLPSKHE